MVDKYEDFPDSFLKITIRLDDGQEFNVAGKDYYEDLFIPKNEVNSLLGKKDDENISGKKVRAIIKGYHKEAVLKAHPDKGGSPEATHKVNNA